MSVDFVDSWSVFGFAQEKEKSVFGFENPDLDVPKLDSLMFNAYWLNLNRDVILLKRWFLQKQVVTDISHFKVQGVYLPRKLVGGGGGGGLKQKNILATIDRVWRGDLGIQDLTRNMARDSG